MAATTTLAHSASNVPSSLRTSGHATPNHGSRSNTPMRIKRLLQAQLDVNSAPIPVDSEVGDEGHNVRRSSSAQVLDSTAVNRNISSGRRRRLSVTTFGDIDGPTCLDAMPTILGDVLARRQNEEAGLQEPTSVALSASLPVLSLQMRLFEYVMLGPDACVALASSQVADPAVKCVVVAVPGATHVLTREVVERLNRYSHDPQTDTLGAYIGPNGACTPTAVPALYSTACVASAAGLLLERPEAQFVAIVKDSAAHSGGGGGGSGGGTFVGLLSRTDLARALLGDRSYVYDTQLTPAASLASKPPLGSPAAAAAAGGDLPHHLPHHPSHLAPQAPPSQQTQTQTQHRPDSAAARQAAAVVAATGITAAAVAPVAAATTMSEQLDGDYLHNLNPLLMLPLQCPAQLLEPPPLSSSAAPGAGGPQLGSAHSHQQNGGSTISDHSAATPSSVPEGLKSFAEPIKSGWDMLDNMDDALDVLGFLGKTVNAEAVGRKLLGDMMGLAANIAGGSSGTSWLFKYLYDGDCSICRTFQAMLEKLDNGMGRVIFVDISQGFNPMEHGGINYKAAMETIHVLSANGQVFKGVTAVIKLLAAVDPEIAANMGVVTAALPLLSLAYMILSKNRHHLSKAWAQVLLLTKADRALFGRDILEGMAGRGASGTDSSRERERERERGTGLGLGPWSGPAGLGGSRLGVQIGSGRGAGAGGHGGGDEEQVEGRVGGARLSLRSHELQTQPST